jgi:glutamate-1-semialdehyde aminotransferase
MTQPGQPGYAGVPEASAPAPRMVGTTDQDQADSAAKGSAPPAAAEEDLSARAARLESELASVRAQASSTETVRLKVEGVHSAFTHNGLTVGTEFTDVPSHAVQAMMEAASDSGVKLTQEES